MGLTYFLRCQKEEAGASCCLKLVLTQALEGTLGLLQGQSPQLP